MSIQEHIERANAAKEVEVVENGDGTWTASRGDSIRHLSLADLAEGVFESWLELARQADKPKAEAPKARR